MRATNSLAVQNSRSSRNVQHIQIPEGDSLAVQNSRSSRNHLIAMLFGNEV